MKKKKRNGIFWIVFYFLFSLLPVDACVKKQYNLTTIIAFHTFNDKKKNVTKTNKIQKINKLYSWTLPISFVKNEIELFTVFKLITDFGAVDDGGWIDGRSDGGLVWRLRWLIVNKSPFLKYNGPCSSYLLLSHFHKREEGKKKLEKGDQKTKSINRISITTQYVIKMYKIPITVVLVVVVVLVVIINNHFHSKMPNPLPYSNN